MRLILSSFVCMLVGCTDPPSEHTDGGPPHVKMPSAEELALYARLRSERWWLDGEPERCAGKLRPARSFDMPPVFDGLSCIKGEVPHGRMTFWYPNGERQTYVENRDGEKHGLELSWSETDIVSVAHYQHGQLAGDAWALDRNGVPLTLNRFEDGQPIEFMSFSEKKTVTMHHRFDDAGLPHGPVCAWKADVKPHPTFELVHGNGPWRMYHPGGQLMLEGSIQQGEKHGAWTYFNASGQPFRVDRYQLGELVSRELLP